MKTITKELAARVLSIVDHGLCKGVGNPIPGQMCVEAAVCFALGEAHSDNPSCVSQVLRQFKIGLNDASWSSNAARAKGLRRIAIAQLGTADTLDERVFVEKLSETVIKKLLPRVLRSVADLQAEPRKTQLLEAATRCETEGTLEAAEAASFAAASSTASRWAYDAEVAAAARWAAKAAAAESSTAAKWAAKAAKSFTAACWAAKAAAAAVRWAAAVAVWSPAAAEAAAALAAAAEAADLLLSEFAEEVVQILVEMKTPGSDFLFLTQ